MYYSNRKKMILLLLAATAGFILIGFLVLSIMSGSFVGFWKGLFGKDSETPETSFEEISFDDSVPRFPGLDISYNHHYFLQDREQGGCRKLVGNVTISFVFLDDKKTVWNEKEKEEFRAASKTVTALLETQARKYGTSLDITEEYVDAKIDGMVILTDYYSWAEDAFKSAGFDKKEFENVEDEYEHPVFFCLSRTGRSLSCPKTGKTWEYGVLYRNEPDYRHELLHLYGAQDYYLTETVVNACIENFPNSVMFSSDRDSVDPLTAYLVGWTNDISREAKNFLDSTMKITKADIEKAQRDNRITGYATIPYGDGSYTGYLLNGVPNNNGKVTFSNGDIYEGEFKDGAFHGHGVYTWNDGYVYDGEWTKGEMTGYGTMRGPDGFERTGNWKNGRPVN